MLGCEELCHFVVSPSSDCGWLALANNFVIFGQIISLDR